MIPLGILVASEIHISNILIHSFYCVKSVSPKKIPSGNEPEGLVLCAEVGFFDVLIDEEFFAGTGHRNLAGFKNIGKVSRFEGHVSILLDEENGNTLPVDLTDDIKDAFDNDRSKTERRLVHHDHLRAAHQSTADCQHLLFTAG